MEYKKFVKGTSNSVYIIGTTLNFNDDDIKELYNMVDVVGNNPNAYTVETDFKGTPRFNPGPYALSHIIDLIAKEGCRIKTLAFIANTPFENFPLYISCPDPYGIISKWRIKIGK